MKLASLSRLALSVRLPSPPKRLLARETMSRPPNQCAARSVRSTGSQWACAIVVPDPPGEAPITATGFTDHDRTLVFEGTSFGSESGLTASEIRSGSDLAVDAQDAEGVLTSDRITETGITDGCWDAAQVELWRVNWADVSQRVLMRRGAIGQIRRGRLAFVAEVRSLAHVLDQSVGRTFQATCDAALGDARCGVDLEDPAFRGTGTVMALSGDRAFTASPELPCAVRHDAAPRFSEAFVHEPHNTPSL
jgi:hypothetical protein